MTDLHIILDDDQFDAERREARRLCEALASDVVAYHTALQDAGIDGELLATLVTQFNARWVGDSVDEVVFAFGGDE